MNLFVLDKIEAHIPGLSELIESYRASARGNVRAAIINAVLASDVRYLSREEVLYLAWLKSDNDKRLRSLDEDLRQRWLEKQVPSPDARPAANGFLASATRGLKMRIPGAVISR